MQMGEDTMEQYQPEQPSIPLQLPEEEEQKISMENFKVEGHLLKWKERLIQIRNIESVSYWIEPLKYREKKAAEKLLAEGQAELKEGNEQYQKALADYKSTRFQYRFGCALLIASVLCLLFFCIVSFAKLILLAVIFGLLILACLMGGLFFFISNWSDWRQWKLLERESNAKIEEGNQKIQSARYALDQWERNKVKAENNTFLFIYMASGHKYSIPFKRGTMVKAVFGVLSNIFANEISVKPFEVNIDRNQIAGVSVEELDTDNDDSYVTNVITNINYVINSTTGNISNTNQ